MLVLFIRKSRVSCRFLHGPEMIKTRSDLAYFVSFALPGRPLYNPALSLPFACPLR
jgi:hypothetical protein